MALSKFLSVWKIISEYRLIVDRESTIDDDLKCVICNKLLRDACLGSSCGCHYCYDCIKEYIDDKDKYCPGVKEECKDQLILLGTNVVRIHILNKRVSKLKVKCPKEWCTSYIELLQMDDHLRLCKKQTMKCPYVAVGCTSEPINRETLDTHMNSDNVSHTELLIEQFQNLKNEVNELKKDSENQKLELKNKEKRIMVLEEQLNKEKEMRINIEKQLTKEIDERRRQIEDWRTENETVVEMVTDLKKGVDDGFGQSKLEMASPEEGSSNKEERTVLQDEELSFSRKEGEILLNEILMKKPRKKIDIRNTLKNISAGKKDGIMDKYDKLCSIIPGDFSWKIEQLSTKTNKRIYSESFYSMNYKLCLKLYVNVYNDHIYFNCHIMKGDNDDMVEWPMKRVVTLSIVDQVTMTAHKSITLRYEDSCKKYRNAYDRPTKEMNEFYIGSLTSFIKYSSIKDKSSIIVNDSIVVSCVVSD